MTHLLERVELGPEPRTRKKRRELKQSVVTKDHLEHALRQAGIRPFSKASVNRYQEETLRVNGPSPLLLPFLIFCGKHRSAFGFCQFLAFMWMAIYTVGAVVALGFVIFGGGGTTSLLSFTGVALLSFAICWLLNYPEHIQAPRWELRRIFDTACLPEQARLTAQEILHFRPEAKLFVDELKQGEEIIDPFLVIGEFEPGQPEPYWHDIKRSALKKSFYVEVWDEPGFKA